MSLIRAICSKPVLCPVFEPRSHQEMHESAAIAVEISRQFHTQVVILPNGNLCHSEGLVHLMEPLKRDPVEMPDSMREFNVLPTIARKNFEIVMAERMPGLREMVESSPLNYWEKGSGKVGIITAGMSDLYVHEVKNALGLDVDILSLAFTNPLPMDLITEFYNSIHGDVFVVEDGYRFIQEAMQQDGSASNRQAGIQHHHRMVAGIDRGFAGLPGERIKKWMPSRFPVPRLYVPAVLTVCSPTKWPY